MENTLSAPVKVNQSAIKKKSAIKRKATKIYPKSIVMSMIFLGLIFFERYSGGSYMDEVLGIVSLVLVVYNWKRISSQDLGTLILLGIVVAMGLISNYINEISHSVFSILVDVLTQIKVPMSIFAIRYTLSEKEKKETVNVLTPIAKLYIIAAFISAIATLFFKTGMADAVRYGLPTFTFIFNYNHQYTSTSFLFFGVIVCSEKISERRKRFYYIIGVLAILAGLKSPSLIFTASFVGLFFYFKKYERLTLKMIIPMVIILLLVSRFQIQEYLLNKTAIRRIFIDYSIVTAKRFFPFGSGFATYGSAEAAKNYSQLYYEYHFDQIWGMTPDYGVFLSDTYWPTVLGQFGFFGFIVYVWFYIRFFIMLKNSKSNPSKKALVYAIFIQYIVHAMGSAILTNACGMIGFMAMAVFAIPDFEYEQKKRRTKFKFAVH